MPKARAPAGRTEISAREPVSDPKLFQDPSEVRRRQDEFLAMFAHEFRNPLAAIGNAAALLENESRGHDGAEGDRLLRIADLLERQVGYLAVMLEDLLDLAEVTQDESTLIPRRADLSKIVGTALETARGWPASRRVSIRFQCPNHEVPVEGDRARLEQAVGKLLSNAVGYTKKGGRVDLTLRTEGELAVLTVADDGVGIDPELLPRIFEPFVQGRAPYHAGRSGLGVGLAIVRHVAELHGGTVDARSEGAGSGAEFVLRLPLAEPVDVPDSAPRMVPSFQTESAKERRAASLRVMVVDDDEDSASILKDLLEAWGYETILSFDGLDAVERACAEKPDIIFLDLGLPKLNGIQVARRIREALDGDRPTIIAMTGYGRPQDVERTREAGFQQHLVKPISIQDMRDLLGRHG